VNWNWRTGPVDRRLPVVPQPQTPGSTAREPITCGPTTCGTLTVCRTAWRCNGLLNEASAAAVSDLGRSPLFACTADERCNGLFGGGFTVREPHPLRTEQAPSSPWAACPLAQSTRTCRESQSARRSPPIPWEDRSRSQIEEHCPAQTPTSRCSSRQHRRQSRFDSGSMHHLVRPVPVGEILVSIRAVHPDPPTTPLPERPSPLAALQRPSGSSRCKSIVCFRGACVTRGSAQRRIVAPAWTGPTAYAAIRLRGDRARASAFLVSFRDACVTVGWRT